MRHVPSVNPFEVKDPYPGATPEIRRALAQVNVESTYMQRVLAAVDALKLKCQVPIYQQNTWAHIGIPSHKTVIFLSGFGNRSRVEVFRERWHKRGWTMFGITPNSIDRTTDSALVEHLKQAMGMGKR